MLVFSNVFTLQSGSPQSRSHGLCFANSPLHIMLLSAHSEPQGVRRARRFLREWAAPTPLEGLPVCHFYSRVLSGEPVLELGEEERPIPDRDRGC